MKHPYSAACDCPRCLKERARRAKQADATPRPAYVPSRRRVICVRPPRRPRPGSQEWAETRGDDLPSLDQPGDDFDMD